MERGIESERKTNGLPIITARELRHSYAVVLCDSGVSVLQAQAWLSHANASTTMGIYAHLSKEREARDTDKLEELFEKADGELKNPLCPGLSAICRLVLQKNNTLPACFEASTEWRK